ncbi:hypothetical protein [Paenibacillus ginsengarvi]|uniref:Uncharacterized protein n=1 Tax=Paenibacillus ginsengarvi TaxID=400777 RepID=A0A3B0C3V0_9BACL|nr:hypothetical protein [Paenibacillus ginsengarvi]RKN78969.1 hypothetical protein D7M11_21595 [Paenibacillus ginsengarvi]
MAEKQILAYFKSREEAEGAAAKLKSLRIEDMRVDEIGRFPGEGSDRIENPVNADFSGLGYLTLGGDFPDRDAAVLAAADASASGMAVSGEDDTMGRNYLLTAVMDEDVHHQALRVVEQGGGLL